MCFFCLQIKRERIRMQRAISIEYNCHYSLIMLKRLSRHRLIASHGRYIISRILLFNGMTFVSFAQYYYSNMYWFKPYNLSPFNICILSGIFLWRSRNTVEIDCLETKIMQRMSFDVCGVLYIIFSTCIHPYHRFNANIKAKQWDLFRIENNI